MTDDRHTVDRYGRDLRPIAFLADARESGIGGGLVTIVGIDGGAPKPIGTYMGVLEDGRHSGNVSGGCVEPAIATEVVPIVASRTDRMMRFGKGSKYIDVRFPCGGGIDLLAHANPSTTLLTEMLRRADRREPFGLAFDHSASTSVVVKAPRATGWQDGVFTRRHIPRTRLILAGRGPDFEVIARVAAAAEFELSLITPDEATAAALESLEVEIEVIQSPRQIPRTKLDAWTATVLLFHEHEWEGAILSHAVSAPGFYIGALGSQRTHRDRIQRLIATGMTPDDIERIRGPIGLVSHARDPATLAISVLAEISAASTGL